MIVAQRTWLAKGGWSEDLPASTSRESLILVFGERAILEDGAALEDLRAAYPGAVIIGCSTAGEIEDIWVRDASLVATIVEFDSTRVVTHSVVYEEPGGAKEAAVALADKFEREELAHLMVFSDGTNVNGSQLVLGLEEALGPGVSVTGGLAGDGSEFERTTVVVGEKVSCGMVAAVGFYGKRLVVGYGSLGGWDQFGPERVITRSVGNVLYEVDDMSVLSLYNAYLGEHAKGLPATGLLFPLVVRSPSGEEGVVRTILGMDEDEQSLTFAGDVPVGSYARLMKANFNRLVDGAEGAARTSLAPMGGILPELAVCISCVGRKMVLKQRVEEETEAVKEVLGDQVTLAGFYSYGEICPPREGAPCELHNQTMTITAFAEADE